jgi:zinc protease
MERCRAQAEAQFVYRLQTVGGFGGKGDQLNAYNVFLGQPDYFDRDLARYRHASAAALQRAAAECLPTESRVILSVIPQGRTAAALSNAAPAVVA